MTSNNNMLRLTAIVIFIVFGCVQTEAKQGFTADDYTGLWFDVGVLHDVIISPYPMTCEWRNVTREDGGRINEVFTFIFKGRPISMTGSVTAVDSEMAIKYAVGKGGTIFYLVKSYDDGNDLILIDTETALASVLISRNLEASEEATADFEILAEELGAYVHSIRNQNCF